MFFWPVDLATFDLSPKIANCPSRWKRMLLYAEARMPGWSQLRQYLCVPLREDALRHSWSQNAKRRTAAD